LPTTRSGRQFLITVAKAYDRRWDTLGAQKRNPGAQAHSAKKFPLSYEAALEFLRRLPLPKEGNRTCYFAPLKICSAARSADSRGLHPASAPPQTQAMSPPDPTYRGLARPSSRRLDLGFFDGAVAAGLPLKNASTTNLKRISGSLVTRRSGLDLELLGKTHEGL